MWVLLMLPRFGGANHADGYDNRSRHREVGFSGAWHRHGREGNVLIRRQLKRRHVLAFFEKLPPCLVGIEACATSIGRASSRRLDIGCV
jgi:transposase